MDNITIIHNSLWDAGLFCWCAGYLKNNEYEYGVSVGWVWMILALLLYLRLTVPQLGLLIKTQRPMMT